MTTSIMDSGVQQVCPGRYIVPRKLVGWRIIATEGVQSFIELDPVDASIAVAVIDSELDRASLKGCTVRGLGEDYRRYAPLDELERDIHLVRANAVDSFDIPIVAATDESY
jgi:hypothetical protein